MYELESSHYVPFGTILLSCMPIHDDKVNTSKSKRKEKKNPAIAK
jgi:hypothetical protein